MGAVRGDAVEYAQLAAPLLRTAADDACDEVRLRVGKWPARQFSALLLSIFSHDDVPPLPLACLLASRHPQTHPNSGLDARQLSLSLCKLAAIAGGQPAAAGGGGFGAPNAPAAVDRTARLGAWAARHHVLGEAQVELSQVHLEHRDELVTTVKPPRELLRACLETASRDFCGSDEQRWLSNMLRALRVAENLDDGSDDEKREKLQLEAHVWDKAASIGEPEVAGATPLEAISAASSTSSPQQQEQMLKATFLHKLLSAYAGGGAGGDFRGIRALGDARGTQHGALLTQKHFQLMNQAHMGVVSQCVSLVERNLHGKLHGFVVAAAGR